MPDLEPHIRRMYADIARFRGGFGDGVESGLYDPFGGVGAAGLTAFERAGVAVAVLHRLDSAIDNTTWEHALADFGQRVRALLEAGRLDHEPLVRASAEAFLVSEAAFVASLGPVYRLVVQRWATE